jgi:NADPH:quinone reductase-like Zn-dependent oxidoreductase
LQFRDLIIAKDLYPLKLKDNLVPLSDCAGEVVAIGEDVIDFKAGDRVCAGYADTFFAATSLKPYSFWLNHLYGPFAEKYKNSSLGASVDGVLTEYRCFPANVRETTF